ncbi:Glycosyltransferase involved in cell wall bisynthesis [Ectothiorhodospira mobilis]|uniref:Glycosyltransferase involved in cell wall bisynthesis n=1 Tax=Ectothiorhodospira mobilis TaxID=195064 RepID=A0A1I4S4N3_ECTMO|nr:glycosyltransferase [Ectothiorhodospira mobilis]SFM59462.1 Glycosyltransferase involved in cell wall bisynthesis [Ectothiorhodospira mobilis]
MTAEARLPILLSLSGEGGVERMVLNLVRELAGRGLDVDLLLIREESRHLTDLPANVRIVRLGTRHAGLAVHPLTRYLRTHRPPVLLAAKDRAGRAALKAARRAGTGTRVFIRLGTTLSQALEGRSDLRRWLRYRPMRRWYPGAAGIIAVSRGVADDVHHITGLPQERLHVVRNPVITPDLTHRAAAPSPHPWLEDGGDPVLLAMGRLTRQKDFPTLLRAFARLQQAHPARLILLGEGGDREALQALAQTLGISQRVHMPGFAANPYAWLARARLFVLSSAWEGSPNALTEAMALGTPVVSTDCRSGPREILQGGRYGPLVPVGDDAALAEAMASMLENPIAPEVLREGVQEYRAETSARRYLEVMGLEAPQ